MLLIEWKSWWSKLTAFEAEERLAAYTVGLLSDAGWQMDREETLSVWRQLAAGAVLTSDGWVQPNESVTVTEADFQPGALRHNARRVFGWLRGHLGSGVS